MCVKFTHSGPPLAYNNHLIIIPDPIADLQKYKCLHEYSHNTKIYVYSSNLHERSRARARVWPINVNTSPSRVRSMRQIGVHHILYGEFVRVRMTDRILGTR